MRHYIDNEDKMDMSKNKDNCKTDKIEQEIIINNNNKCCNCKGVTIGRAHV